MTKKGCLGYSMETSYGKEYDCEYPNSSGFSCEDCIFGPHPETAKWNPKTGKKIKRVNASSKAIFK
jgi:hypothetical protein